MAQDRFSSLLSALSHTFVPLFVLAVSIAAPAQAQDGGGAGFEEIEAPVADRSGVFVTQIGNTNRADVDQPDGQSFAQVVQDGADNAVDLAQRNSGNHYASIAQSGDANAILAAQEGAGETILLLGQEGNENSATISQTDNGLANSAAAILQSGNQNSIVLIQDGDDNQARLTQNGDGNAMTATQLDVGNRLEWVQNGSGLSDLQITQTGGANLQITQSNGGGGN